MSKNEINDECMGSEYDLFSRPSVDTSTHKSSIILIRPVDNTIATDGFQFTYTGTHNEYVDLSETYLKLEVGIKKEDGTYLPKTVSDNELVGPVNNFFHSLFDNIEVTFKDKPTESNVNYAYKAYITDLLNYNKHDRDTWMRAQLFSMDTEKQFDALVTQTSGALGSNNKGLLERIVAMNEATHKLQLRGKLHIDVFNTNRLLLNNVSFHLKFKLNKSSFSLMSSGLANNKFEVGIRSAILCITKVEPSLYILNSHASHLLNQKAIYPYTRITVTQPIINLDSVKVQLTLQSSGVIPKRVILGFVKNTSTKGAYNENPFNFANQKVTSIHLQVNETIC